ncbi:MAG: alpha/beta fold hydrolase [Thiohalocapsa sp.]
MFIFSILAFVVFFVVALIPAGVHLGFRAPRIREIGSPADFGLDYQQVRIATVRGRHLFGWLLPSPGSPRSVVVLHGWGSNAELMLPLAAPLHRAGLNVLLCDARNHGNSDGDNFSSLPRFAEDLNSAIAWLQRYQPDSAKRIAVVGHSVGAGATLFEASRNPAISAVVSIAAFAHPAEVTERYLRHLHIPRPVTKLVIRYVEWIIGHRFDAIAPINTCPKIPCPVLLVHGMQDQTVPIVDARRIAANCPGKGTGATVHLLEIEDARHDSTEAIERHVGGLLRFLDESWATNPSVARDGANR